MRQGKDEAERMIEVGKSPLVKIVAGAFGVIALVLGTVGVLSAQTIGQRLEDSRRSFGGGEGFYDPSGRAFTFCRAAYNQVRREPMGQGWRTDYPDADRNLMLRLSQLTTTPIRTTRQGRPDHLIVELTDEEIFECPFVFMSDVGTMRMNLEEVQNLRRYLNQGGFLWVDDFWGSFAWEMWVQEISKVLPPGEHPIEDVPADHMLFSALYNVLDGVPQIPSIQFWRRGQGTSEQGFDSSVPHLRSIKDDKGRIVVLMSHNTDIADGWEREGEDDAFFFAYSPKAYALGINIIVYAMTH